MNLAHARQRTQTAVILLALAAVGGYCVWRIAAHRLHLHGASSIVPAVIVFMAGFIFSAYWWGHGAAGRKALASCVLVASCVGLVYAAAFCWSLYISDPGPTAAWMLVMAATLGAVDRIAKRMRT